MTEAQTEVVLAHIADVLGVQPGAAYPTSKPVIAFVMTPFDRNLALIDNVTGLSAAETKGFEEIESFAPYHEMPAFLAGFENYVDGVRVAFGSSDATAQAYDRGLMAASLCQRLGL